ncbi:lamin tail domain-containing protein [Halosimplex amylolyticum]|uniref:lamin tail domain-containing protein n=1 Tax=Halosimplex amylolyticum TaxID=3396616 RepID=UPI003F56EE8D
MNERRSEAVVAVAVLAVLSGCAGFGVNVGERAGGPTASAPDVANGTTATVVEVVDGDTIDVRYRNGSTDTVRLLGVDTPEVHADNDPAEYEGVPDDESGAACLESAGEDASAFARERLAGERVTLVVDPTADRRDRYDRLLAYVHVDDPADDGTPANETGEGIDFNQRLVATGHARVYDSTFARSDGYYAAESEAQDAERGLWRCRTPGADGTDDADGVDGTDGTDSGDAAGALATSDSGLTVERVHADADGNDHENLNDEYVVFGNAADAPLPLGGWVVRDEGGHSYAFPGDFALGPGETVVLRTGAGEDADGTLYWGSDSAVWNNGGDAVAVERDGETVLRYAYG